MAPFEPPEVVLTGFKERVEAFAIQGDNLYIGTANGNLSVYSIVDPADGKTYTITHLETKKNLTRKAIDQLGFVKDINSLVVLSQSQVTLFNLPELSKPTPLSKAKSAFSFSVHTSVQHLYPDGKTIRPQGAEFGSPVIPVPTVITNLVVGCQRKLVVYSWKDGEAQDIKEAPLPHSARTIAFLNPEVVCLAYETDHVLFSLDTMSTIEIASAPTTSKSGASIGAVGMGAFTGLGGYMTLGLGAKLRPCVTNVSDAEVLIAKDNEGLFVGINGKPSRKVHISWPAPPEDVSFVKPYIFSILPAGSVPKAPGGDTGSALGQPTFYLSPVLQIHSSLSLLISQSLPFPFNPPQPTSLPPACKRQLYSAPLDIVSICQISLFLVSTPTDRATAAAEGSSIWCFRMKAWGAQVDELVNAGKYAEALALLNTIDPAVLPDKDRRTSLVKSLEAVSQFRAGEFDRALDSFVELNINPAKVISLYSYTISGRLAVPREQWIQMFGGPVSKLPHEASSPSSSSSEHDGSTEEPALPVQAAPPAVGIVSKLKNPLDAIRPSSSKDPEAASISSKRDKPRVDNFSRSVESLLRYLPDRRQKLLGALEAFHITPAQSNKHASLSDTSSESLRGIPDTPFPSLTPEQLVLCAQVVDTALFKSYLVVRPGLLGPLCRRDNWCEVAEVEEVLVAREKMHPKALELLRKLGEEETDVKDRLGPSIAYLQRLGPEYLDTVFQYSRWILDESSEMALEIFNSEETDLPPQHVANFLESVNPKFCALYLEFLIKERHEESYIYHDRLAELYLKMTVNAKKVEDEESREEAYDKLLLFVDSTTHYRVDRLLGLLPSDDLFEARAILLGRLGRHDSALELYVYRLHDYEKAERYCNRIHKPDGETCNIFLTLLRIYLRPLVRTTDNLLRPALDLIARHGPRLDPEETLQLLPPLVAASDVHKFLIGALRVPRFDARVVRSVALARNEQVARKLMYLEANRVKITDSRMYALCFFPT
ncbi:CNH domain-containing protein [Multifurca ochricompacta]|uniref:CNH domain-containing protein n=1 Tax=Multifurca ochricompacta TaxID=376703 RepID=A0AAD4M6B2_9AGAM|nr:CNH domain-containing protein [Multifurca ochricompacta]